MHRESLLGVALAATLAELESVCRLSERQKEQLWDIFDVAMDRTLAEAPVMSRVRVFSPHPSLLKEGGHKFGASGVVAPVFNAPKCMVFPSPEVLQSSPTSLIPPCDVLDDGTTYPVYRVHDGVWTILLKNPVVEVRAAGGSVETIHLDYLKVHLKDVSLTDNASGKGAPAGNKKRRIYQ